MRETTLHAHIQAPSGMAPVLYSAAGHLLLLIVVTLGSSLLSPAVAGESGGGGLSGIGASVIPVTLSSELTGGGSGNVAPALTPAREAVEVKKRREEVREDRVELPRFEDPKPDKTAPESPDAPPAPDPVYNREERPGDIPRENEAGAGGKSSGIPGDVGGLVSGTGLRIGSGGGTGGVAGWYVRQLEQRIAQNWLRASLGDLSERVLTRMSFTVGPAGQIQDIRLLQSSGNQAVDRAAQRALLASSPLPPLPVELRSRRVEFVAHFEYPPK